MPKMNTCRVCKEEFIDLPSKSASLCIRCTIELFNTSVLRVMQWLPHMPGSVIQHVIAQCFSIELIGKRVLNESTGDILITVLDDPMGKWHKSFIDKLKERRY